MKPVGLKDVARYSDVKQMKKEIVELQDIVSKLVSDYHNSNCKCNKAAIRHSISRKRTEPCM